MRGDIRQGFSVLAAIGVVATAIGCGGSNETEVPALEAVETQATSPPAPPPPGSPLPDDLQLDAGGGAPDATPDGVPVEPVTPAFRTIWAVDTTNQLVKLTSREPVVLATRKVTGLAINETIVGMDFRPSDGKLYALGTTSRLYTLDRESGIATAVGGSSFSPALAGTSFGFDVNPVADKLRVHSDTDQNLRLDPVTGTATIDGTLAFAQGDENFGQSPNLVAAAYTNSVRPAPSTTTLYAIDSTRNLLTKLSTPNDGKVSTIGPLGVDVTEVAGFDIWGAEGSSDPAKATQAYAALVVAGKAGLYTIDLAKGTATLVGEIKHPNALTGFAIEP